MSNNYDCIVVGGGHAGIEAAHAAARMGAKTCLVTLRRNLIGEMSCNPAIGGLAKGQIVREIDALGGLMGLATDATGIQFRMLNRSKGEAVQSPRAQVDRYKYVRWMRETLEQTDNLDIVEGVASEIITERHSVRGLRCRDGSVYGCETLIIATGTFLGGRLFTGDKSWAGGRIGEAPSVELSESLRRTGLETSRMATDTTPRLDARSCELDKLQVQRGDEKPIPFSFMSSRILREQIPCWITYTDERIHKLLRDNLHRAPLSSGQITGADPRYCPSIEGKVVRFADKKQHRIFLEPEEESVETIYCNGIFTSMPGDVQQQMLRLLPGTEKAKIIHYAYAVEYDYCPPVQLQRTLECRKIAGLFLAGQINGTSGYEEAGGQGIIAGINAVRKLQGKEGIVLGRDQAYIGVLIDDLLTKGIDEPYRMFTSRAEYRLSLRADNADRRLTTLGHEVGLVEPRRWARFMEKLRQIECLREYLHKKRWHGVSYWEQLRRPGSPLAGRLKDEEFIKQEGLSEEVVHTLVTDAKYEGYLAKQQRLASAASALESKSIPPTFEYDNITHLRNEAKEKLSIFRPATVGQAMRISGVTPADITVLEVYLKNHYREKD